MAQYYEGIGRRKASTARVRVSSGSGKFTVNEKEAAAFFTRYGDVESILRPFNAVGQEANKYDVTVLVNGGGVAGQAESVRLGIARALQIINADWTSALRKKGLLTRDARIKERKKPGLKKARKAPTYTKR
ncbi:MAG TPA: 30S ribosomal protein S9 [Anaerolineales bacterium]|jgi:small subunit ribosomal protein S9|nr:30S ribosomal protein S9 [Anaerolineae bacterium]HRJ57719.1 30S ribosomal protein S9 [Anaerolineales bacterium]HRK89355.1 30S ribosomal protein S9 [Anaerolineales bacterium]